MMGPMSMRRLYWEACIDGVMVLKEEGTGLQRPSSLEWWRGK